MVRSIPTAPDAKPLFARAISVSDTSNYGISPESQADNLGEIGLKTLGCAIDDLKRARSKSTDDVLNASGSASGTLFGAAIAAQTGVTAAGEIYKPVEGRFIPSSLEKDVSSGKGIGKGVVSIVSSSSFCRHNVGPP